MVINNSLYTYGFKPKNRKKIIKKIMNGDKIKKLHVVVLPIFGDGLLEIYPYNQLLQPIYNINSNQIKVVGIAKEHGGAVSLVQDMIQDIYDCDCNFDVNKFFGM